MSREVMAFTDPDVAGKWHLRHPRMSEVSTACGGSLIFLDTSPEWARSAESVPTDDRCQKCWGREASG